MASEGTGGACAFAASFAEVRRSAEEALLSGREGRFEVCSAAWMIVSRLHNKEGSQPEEWPYFSITYRTPMAPSVAMMSGNVHVHPGGPRGSFPAQGPGSSFPEFLSSWEKRGRSEMSETIRNVLCNARKAGMTRESLLDAWDESIVSEVMGS